MAAKVPSDLNLSVFETPPRPRQCTVYLLLEDLTPDQRALALQALETPEYRSSRIAKVLSEWSPARRVSDQTVSRHRAGRCACE